MRQKKLDDRKPPVAYLTRRVDQVCDRYEAAWKLAVGAGGRPPRMEEYLEGSVEPEHSALRHELEELASVYRQGLRSGWSGTPASEPPGEAKTDGAYSTGSPARSVRSAPRKAACDPSDPTATFEIADKPLADAPGLEQENDHKTHASSKQLRCLHCHHPLELLDDGREEVRCPGCGSSFRVCDARETTPLPPSRALGRFKLLERVGAGAYGEVWRAFDPELDRTVAIKIPHPALASEPSQLERFYREARAAAQLRHPGIVSVHEVVMLNGLPVIVSDFIDGVPLRHLLAEQRLTFREAAELTAQLADALDYAHSMGLVHRDIKPGNIMVLRSEGVSGGVVSGEWSQATPYHSPLTTHHSPVIMDFGLALREEAEITMTLDGHVVGTPAYMSPEQAVGQGHRADRRSDVYSLGVILYEMLTGELPFRGSKKYMLQQVQSEEPRPPRKINDKIPRDLETIVLKAMAKAPARRYATARDLADELRRFLKGEPILARRVGRTEKVLRWCRRNPAPAIAAAVVLGAILAVTVSVSVAAVESRAAQRISEEKQKTEDQRNLLLLHHGRTLGEQGEIGQGMLWQARGLSADPNANSELQRVLRLNLAAFARQLNPLREILPHSSDVRVVGFSPDGKLVATGCADGTIHLWDALTDKAKGDFQLHKGAVRVLAFSPDSHWLLSGSEDKTAQLLDLAAGKPDGEPPRHNDAVLAVAFTPDGQTILTATGKGAFQLDRHTRKSRDFLFPVKNPSERKPAVLMVAFSPDGKRVLESDSGSTRLWDLSAVSPSKPLLTVQHAALSSIVWNPDGRRFLTGDREGDVRIWSVDGGSPAEPILHLQAAVHALAFSADGKMIVTGSEDKTAALWYADTLKPIGQPLVDRGIVRAVAFDPTGQSVVVGSTDATARLWDVAPGGTAGPRLQHPGQIHVLAYSPEGKRILLGGYDRSARIWDAHTGKMVADLRSDLSIVASAAFAPNGKTVVTGGLGANLTRADGTSAYLWDAESGKPLYALKHPARLNEVNHVNFSPDGKIITTAGDENVCLWDAATGKILGKPLPHTGAAYQAIFSPDGSLLLTAGHDNKAYLWETGTGRLLRQFAGHQAAVYAVAFSSDAKRILTGSSDRTGRLWDTASGRQIGPVLQHEDEVRIVAFSPDDRSLLTGSWDNTVRLWDAATGQLKGPVLQHQGKIFSATFNADGRLVLTGSNDRTARLWDTATGEAIGPMFRHQEGVTCVAFNPDGQSFATASNDKTAQTWELPAGLEGEVERLAVWTRVITGMELAPDTGLRVIEASRWRQLRQQLGESSGIRRSGR